MFVVEKNSAAGEKSRRNPSINLEL